MSDGKLFQSLLPAIGKARSPTVTSLVAGTYRSADNVNAAADDRGLQLVECCQPGAMVLIHADIDKQSQPVCSLLIPATSASEDLGAAE